MPPEKKKCPYFLNVLFDSTKLLVISVFLRFTRFLIIQDLNIGIISNSTGLSSPTLFLH